MDHVVLEIDLHLINNIRVIYYVVTKQGRLLLMMMYAKSKQDNMNDKQKAMLKAVVSQLSEE